MPVPRSYVNGKKHYEAARYREAIFEFRVTLEHNLHFMPTYYFLGKAYLATHQFQLALICFSEFFLSADESEKCNEYISCLEESKQNSFASPYLNDPTISQKDKELLLNIKQIQEKVHQPTVHHRNQFWDKPRPPVNPKSPATPSSKTTLS